MVEPTITDIVEIIYKEAERTLNDFIEKHSQGAIAPKPFKLKRSAFFGTELEGFLFKVCDQIANRLYHLESNLEQYGIIFDRYKSGVTKFSPAQLEIIWMEISKTIGENIYSVAEIHNQEIPGLERFLETKNLPLAGEDSGTSANVELVDVGFEAKRERRANRFVESEKYNNLFAFFPKFRENIFQNLRERFGLFKNSESDITRSYLREGRN